jgi:hypothetical protein
MEFLHFGFSKKLKKWKLKLWKIFKNFFEKANVGEFWYIVSVIILMRGTIMRRKKQLILLILKMLESSTDEKHPMTQTQIANIISSVQPCDRKTVSRNINFLKEVGYPIVKTTKGFYMDNKVFTKEEVDFVKLAILSCESKSKEEKEALANDVVRCMMKKYFIK